MCLQTAENTFVDALRTLIHRNFDLKISQASGKVNDVEKAQRRWSSDTLHSDLLTATNDNTSLLQALIQDLRHARKAIEGTGEIFQQYALFAKDVPPLQAIRTQVDYLGPYFASSDATEDARIARSLASMLGCIQRLQGLYRSSTRLPDNANSSILDFQQTGVPTSFVLSTEHDQKAASTSHDTKAGTEQESNDIYQTLHRQAKALQVSSARTSRTDSQDSGNTVYAVEEAELELLWGRVDDLLEIFSQLCRRRSSLTRTDHLRTGVDLVLVGPTPLMTNNDPSFSTPQHTLPAYTSADPPEYSDEGDVQKAEAKQEIDCERESEEKDHLDSLSPSPQQTRQKRRHGNHSDEKMQLDLDRLTTAIERLYVASPQLANQRVDSTHSISLNRGQLRELQLAKLGTAIEKLSKGRLEDQRAVLDPVQLNEPILHKVAHRKPKNDLENLDGLLDAITRAASRTLDDQRVSIR